MDAREMLTLWEEHKGLVFKAARIYSGAMEIEDLAQQGFILLVEAASAYNSERGAAFPCYAFMRVKTGLFRYVAENAQCIRIPEYMQRYIRKYRKTVQAIRRDEGREPYREELLTALCIDLETLEAIEACEGIENPASLSAPLPECDGEELTLADVVADPSDIEREALEAANNSEVRERIQEALQLIPEEEAAVISAHYLEEKSIEETAALIGEPVEECRKLKTKGINKLRAGKRRLMLISLYESKYSDAYKGGGLKNFNRTWTSSTERAALSRAPYG